MEDRDQNTHQEEIYSKVLRAGRRTYFFDVRSTRADDFYLTITESKKHTNQQGEVFYKKHKVYLYKEDFDNFKEMLEDTTQFIVDKRGPEVISEKHQPDFHKKHAEPVDLESESTTNKTSDHSKSQDSSEVSSFTDVDFEDI